MFRAVHSHLKTYLYICSISLIFYYSFEDLEGHVSMFHYKSNFSVCSFMCSFGFTESAVVLFVKDSGACNTFALAGATTVLASLLGH